MANPKSAQFIQPPTTLQDKFAGSKIDLSPEQIKAAEAALEKEAEDLTESLLSDIATLQASAEQFRVNHSVELSELFRQSFDLKSLGGTLGFPLLTGIGETLCKLFEQQREFDDLDHTIVDAHITAMRAIVAHNIRNDDDETAQAILTDLAKLVARARDADSE